VIRKRARALFLLSTCLALGTSFPAPGQRELAFTDPAPLKQLLSRGVTAGSVESGLSFAASLTGGAEGIRAGPFMLRIPGAPKPLELVLERPRIEADFLDAVARIHNVSGAFAGGLRLDMLEISEGAPAPDGPGTRGQSVGKPRPLRMDSPLYFGDLPPGADAAVPLHVGPLNLTPSSPFVILRGIVSGAAAFGTAREAGGDRASGSVSSQ